MPYTESPTMRPKTPPATADGTDPPRLARGVVRPKDPPATAGGTDPERRARDVERPKAPLPKADAERRPRGVANSRSQPAAADSTAS